MAAHSILPVGMKTSHGLGKKAEAIWSMVHGPCALSRQPSAVFALALVALALLATSASLRAHDIPNDVTVQTFVKPEGTRLRLLVRVPLQAMRDMDYPKPRGTTRGDLMDLGRAESTLRDASTLWISDFLDVYENDVQLPKPQVVAVRAALPSDRSFTSYEEALAHVTGPPLPPETEFVWSQGLLDVLFDYPIQSDRSKFSIEPRLARLGIRTLIVMRFLPPGGAVRAFEFYGDPGLVRLDPSWFQAAWQFVKLGFFHILDGTDHLLFLGCLVIPFRRFRSLIAVVTAFTVAHSITLIASAYNLAPDALWFPPLIETLIATSIVYMALENIVFAASASTGTQSPQRSQSTQNTFFSGRSPDDGLGSTGTPASAGSRRKVFSATSANSATSALRRRWLVTFGFGLVHGFGFSFALRQTLQFAGSHLLTSLFSFNIGVELGQLLVLVLLIPALELLFRGVVVEWLGTIILSALVGHTAWHWMGDRYAVLRQFRFEWPVIDAAFLAGLLRWAMLVVVAIALYWLVFGVLRVARKDERAGDPFTRAADRSS
jgi:HupE/UreJ protein